MHCNQQLKITTADNIIGMSCSLRLTGIEWLVLDQFARCNEEYSVVYLEWLGCSISVSNKVTAVPFQAEIRI